jgi:hypothetical protein
MEKFRREEGKYHMAIVTMEQMEEPAAMVKQKNLHLVVSLVT